MSYYTLSRMIFETVILSSLLLGLFDTKVHCVFFYKQEIEKITARS